MNSCSASRDRTYMGMKTLVLENESLRIVILLDKGGDIMELTHKPSDMDFMWRSPIGYRKPGTHVPSSVTPDSAFMDLYGGGWQDLLPVVGHGPIEHRGAEWGLHGETGILPWESTIEEESDDTVVARLEVSGYRYPYKVEKRLQLNKGESKLRIRERLTNTSSQDLDFAWLQHPAFGEPFITTRSRIDTSAKQIFVDKEETAPIGRLKAGTFEWPIAKGRNGQDIDLSMLPDKDVIAEETAFLGGMDEAWYAITNPEMRLGFAMSWSNEVFGWLWFWQNFNPPDYPWYGKAWNIALEPCTSYPGKLSDQINNKSTLRLPGGGSVNAELVATIYTGFKRVQHMSADGEIEGES